MIARTRLVLAAVVLAAVLGCSKSSSGGSGACRAEPAPASGPGDVSNLFPLAPGDAWVYQLVPADGSSSVPGDIARRHRRWVAGTRQVGAREAAVVLERDADDPAAEQAGSLLAVTPGGVVSIGTSSELPGVGEVTVLRFPVTVGASYEVASCSRVDLGLDVDDDGQPDAFDVRETVQVGGFEDVTVPAGRFAQAVRVLTRVEVTAYASGGGQGSASVAETDWLASGVGLVKSSIDDGSGMPPTVIDLAGYTVGGASRGLGEAHVLFSESGSQSSRCPALAAAAGKILGSFWNANLASPPLRAVMMSLDGGTLSDVTAIERVLGVPAVAFDGTRFLLAVADLNTGSTAVYGRRFDTSGAGLDAAAGFPIVDAATLGGGSLGDVAAAGASGGGFQVVLVQSTSTAYQALWGVHVAGDGTVSAPRLLYEGEFIRFPAIAAGPGGSLVAWEESSFAWTPVLGSSPAIRALRLGPDGAPLDAAPIDVSSPLDAGQTLPAVASDGAGWLVAWQASLGHHDPFFDTPFADLAGARIDASGALRDGPATAHGFTISGSDHGARTGAAVAFDGTRYLAAFQLSSPYGSPDYGWGGIRAFALGADARPEIPPSGFGLDVTGAPLEGHVLDCPILLSPDDGPPVIVWRDQTWQGPGAPPPDVSLRAARLAW
ncbi:hypothetical protein [Anaeromyxobacter oryzae]|uniref:Lipoprotein n=1 Tax=Anaeromyxobacter oryzae TaxID=2918170 RepID=A0ABM7WSG4_9BACT|nr:hypothetical protein [Anaeromyxobacter oryzae]BDG02419.1 hypothetical protein AMOR_14150 [Anaeromyxobacter oryzae]